MASSARPPSALRPPLVALLPLLLLAPAPSAGADLRLDGGAARGWDADRWRAQVDGVMGGRSSGTLRFEDGGTVLSFSGVVDLDGGGFASVRRSFGAAATLDLTPYAGIEVRLATTRARGGGDGDGGGDVQAPLGLHLQLHDGASRYGFAAAFAVPLSDAAGEETAVFLPLASFDRGSRMGFACNDCRLDASRVNEMDLYVLFQEGPFDVKVTSIAAVERPVRHPSPVIEVGSAEEVRDLIAATTRSGGGLYNQGYGELCNAIYRSTLNSLLAARSPRAGGADDDGEGVVTATLRGMACEGLRRAAAQDKADAAWTLRHTLDGILEALGFLDPDLGTGWRPSGEAGGGNGGCRGVTAGAYAEAATTTAPSAAPVATPTSGPAAAPATAPSLSPSAPPTAPPTLPPPRTPAPSVPSDADAAATRRPVPAPTLSDAGDPAPLPPRVPAHTVRLPTGASTVNPPASTPQAAAGAAEAPGAVPPPTLAAPAEAAEQQHAVPGNDGAPSIVLTSSSASPAPRAGIVATLAAATVLCALF